MDSAFLKQLVLKKKAVTVETIKNKCVNINLLLTLQAELQSSKSDSTVKITVNVSNEHTGI